MAQPNGPRAGRGTGRFRNTLANNASKNPVVGPSSGYQYGAELGMLGQNLLSTLAGLRAQKGLIAQQFATSKADARAARVAGAQSTEAAALASGTVGGSADLANRAGVVAQQKTDVAAAIQAKLAGKLGLRQERLAAQNEYHTGVFDVMARKAAEEAEMANQAFLEDMVMRKGDETSSLVARLKELLAQQGGGGGGKPADSSHIWRTADMFGSGYYG